MAAGSLIYGPYLVSLGVPDYTAYYTTKHDMIGFTRTLALEVVNRGITVNTVCPGWVDTEMATQGINETAAGVPIKRFLEADKIAELVCYLTLDQANGNHRPSD